MMVLVFVAGIGALLLGFLYWQSKRQQAASLMVSMLLQQAEGKAKLAVDAALLEAKNIVLQAESKASRLLQEYAKQEKLLETKEEHIGREKLQLTQKQQELLKKEKALQEREKQLVAQELMYQAKLTLTPEQARQQVIDQAQKEADKDCQLYYLHKRQQCDEQVEKYAHNLVVTVLGRLGHKALSDATTCQIELPHEEMKAKIIGREGKNIKAFQQLTGVTVVIDDTPQTLVLSCFDPQRREVAKIALLKLIQDGRITAERIETEVQAAAKELDQWLIKYGQEAASFCALAGLHPTLLLHLGRLKLRSSFGQNLLDHSVEVANIMGLIAAELKLNVSVATRMGLLHDIGKAQVADIPLSHALAGYRLCLDCGESQQVANGVGCHHNEMPAESLEAMLVQCADYLSGARLGARAENGEQVIKRLSDFEAHALSFSGVKSAFALAAGRELQVFVRPEVVSDAEALVLAKQIAQKIQPLSPAMRIQVSVIRETKSIHYT